MRVCNASMGEARGEARCLNNTQTSSYNPQPRTSTAGKYLSIMSCARDDRTLKFEVNDRHLMMARLRRQPLKSSAACHVRDMTRH